MVLSSIFSVSSLSNFLKYEDVRSTDGEDEGRNKLLNKSLLLNKKRVYDGGNCVISHAILLIAR